jgi:hypothetical protein
VERAFRLALARPPTPKERQRSLAFLERRRAEYASGGSADPGREALVDLGHVLFNLNAFVYVD